MVSRSLIYKIFAVIIIVSFLTGLFVVMMSSSSNQQGNGTPTPTPTVQAEEFAGVGTGTARVLKFGPELLVECENASREAADAVRNVPGVTLSLLSSGKAINARLNASLNGSDFQQVADQVENALWDYCEPSIYRNAELILEGTVNLTNPTNNQTRIYNQRTLSTVFQQAGFKGVAGWVTLQAELNETVGVAVIVQLQAEETPFAFVQEERPVFESLQARTGVLEAKVEELKNEGMASVRVPWEARDLNTSALEAELGSENLTATASYSAKDFFYYNISTNESGWNETREAIGNLSFVTNVNAREDLLVIFVDSNYTDQKAALAEIKSNVAGAKEELIEFPTSELTLTFSFSGSFDSALASLEPNLPGVLEAAKRKGSASIVNVSAAREALGVGKLPELFEALVNGSAQTGETVNMSIFASARGKRIVSIQGEQE